MPHHIGTLLGRILSAVALRELQLSEILSNTPGGDTDPKDELWRIIGEEIQRWSNRRRMQCTDTILGVHSDPELKPGQIFNRARGMAINSKRTIVQILARGPSTADAANTIVATTFRAWLTAADAPAGERPVSAHRSQSNADDHTL